MYTPFTHEIMSKTFRSGRFEVIAVPETSESGAYCFLTLKENGKWKDSGSLEAFETDSDVPMILINSIREWYESLREQN